MQPRILAAMIAVGGAVSIALATPRAAAAAAQTAPSPPPPPQPLVDAVQNAVQQMFAALPPGIIHSRPSSSTSNGASSTASGDGVRYDPADTCVSCTSAEAGPGTATARSQVVRVNGQDYSAGQSSAGTSNSGNVAALPANPLVALVLAGWATSTDSSSSASSAHARSSLLNLSLADGRIVTVGFIESASNASANPSTSRGDSATNGVTANGGQGMLVVIVLHADGSSNGQSDVYLASVNDKTFGTSDQTGGGVGINVPGGGTITLIRVGSSGGHGGSAEAGASSDTAGRQGNNAHAFGASGQPAASGRSQSGWGSARASNAAGSGGSQSANAAGGGQGASAGAANGAALGAPSAGAGLGIGGFILLGMGILAVRAGSRHSRRAVRSVC